MREKVRFGRSLLSQMKAAVIRDIIYRRNFWTRFSCPGKTEPSVHIVPEAVEELRVMRPCSSSMWMYINKKNQTGCDIQLCDETGIVCAEIKGIRMRRLSQQDHGQEEQSEMMIFEEMWTQSKAFSEEIHS